eukprot:g71198.t1
MASSTEWSTGHSNAWPPTQACPQTAPFRLGGKVVKSYPLTVKLNHKSVNTAAEKDIPQAGTNKPKGPQEVKYTALEVKVDSYIRLPAEGEESDEKPIDAKQFRKNFDAYLEYWMGYEMVAKLPKMECKIPHFWTGPDTWVLWASAEALKSAGDAKAQAALLKAGAEVDLTTTCSTNTVAFFGETAAATKKGGLALDQSALARFKVKNEEDEDEGDDWD